MLTAQLSHDHMTEPFPAVGAQLVGGSSLMGFGAATEEQLVATANGLIKQASPFNPSSTEIKNAMMLLDLDDARRLGQILIAKGVPSGNVGSAIESIETGKSIGLGGKGSTIWGILATASAAASAYHGYKRNDSIGWGVWWFFMGGLFPILVPTIALAQGFGKEKR